MHPTYLSLPGHTSQQIIKFLVKSWKSFFKALKVYFKSPNKFKAKPQPPNYKRRGGFHTLFFTSDQVKIRDGYVYFPAKFNLRIKTRLDVKVNHARIIPKGNSFLLEIIYHKDIPALQPINNIAAVDFGINNLITCVSTVGSPIFIKGKAIKSYNQWYNKQRAKLSSIYKKQNPNSKFIKYGARMKHLNDRRYKKMENLLHTVSRKFINYCMENDIDTIIIGYNDGWKQGIQIGKINNQNFVNMPFLTLLRKIEYKAEDAGIKVIRTEESYTSKSSFLDNEDIGKHVKYVGRREKRGQFRSMQGILLNADCNGAGNIGRKVFPMLFNYGIVDVVSHPLCLSV